MSVTYTTHYNLAKPGYDELADIALLNSNADTIDAAIYGAATMIEDSVETSTTAADPYENGAYFIMSGQLYRATEAIAVGDTLTPNTNCVAITVMDEVVRLVNAATLPDAENVGF